LVSNVEILSEDADQIVVASAFNLTASRKSRIDIVAGRSTHTLKRADQQLRIAAKKIVLTNRDAIINNLTYLV
jgi:3-phenylpropionate/cinnamic acid dioxygenase small subunit